MQPARAQRIFHPTDPPKGASPGAIARRENWNPRMATIPGDVPIAITMYALSPNCNHRVLYSPNSLESNLTLKSENLANLEKVAQFSIF